MTEDGAAGLYEIPAASSLGLAVLALLVAIAGCAYLIRVRS